MSFSSTSTDGQPAKRSKQGDASRQRFTSHFAPVLDESTLTTRNLVVRFSSEPMQYKETLTISISDGATLDGQTITSDDVSVDELNKLAEKTYPLPELKQIADTPLTGVSSPVFNSIQPPGELDDQQIIAHAHIEQDYFQTLYDLDSLFISSALDEGLDGCVCLAEYFLRLFCIEKYVHGVVSLLPQDIGVEIIGLLSTIYPGLPQNGVGNNGGLSGFISSRRDNLFPYLIRHGFFRQYDKDVYTGQSLAYSISPTLVDISPVKRMDINDVLNGVDQSKSKPVKHTPTLYDIAVSVYCNDGRKKTGKAKRDPLSFTFNETNRFAFDACLNLSVLADIVKTADSPSLYPVLTKIVEENNQDVLLGGLAEPRHMEIEYAVVPMTVTYKRTPEHTRELLEPDTYYANVAKYLKQGRFDESALDNDDGDNKGRKPSRRRKIHPKTVDELADNYRPDVHVSTHSLSGYVYDKEATALNEDKDETYTLLNLTFTADNPRYKSFTIPMYIDDSVDTSSSSSSFDDDQQRINDR